MRSAVERSSAGCSSRFSASRIRLAMLTAKKAPNPASIHQKSVLPYPKSADPGNPGPIRAPGMRRNTIKPTPLVKVKNKKRMIVPAKIREDTARDFERHERKRAVAHIQRD